MTERTEAGHDPQALMVLTGAIRPHVLGDPFPVAVGVFATLHDAGLRLVSVDEED